MGEKIVVGAPINHGLQNYRTAFVIDNDSFPLLNNAYTWRGRVKRKRGTSYLGRLERYFDSTKTYYSSIATTTLDGSGQANILTAFGLEAKGQIVQGSVTITDTTSSTVYTDPTQDGYLTPTGTSGPNTIHYSSGQISIPSASGNTIEVQFNYYPCRPVLGLKDVELAADPLTLTPIEVDPVQFPSTLAFDDRYAYVISNIYPFSIYDVSFYKNPPTSGGYTQKTEPTPLRWNGGDYQQFYSTNYEGSTWVTNGINVPFTVTSIGMQYKPIATVTVVSATQATLNIVGHNLVVGDFVFVNEVTATTGINFQTGYVITVTDSDNVIVEFPQAAIATNGTGGICQYLTNTADSSKDCIRFYDGDPTNGSTTAPTFTTGKGWVNYAPPLCQSPASIGNLPPAIYYLAGARLIVPFKDRLLFFGPVVQTAAPGSQVYLPDTIVYSQNGTPYYTCSYTNTPTATVDNPTSPTNVFTPLVVPNDQIATPFAYFFDQTGYGGFLTAGIPQAIVAVSTNEDVLIVGFTRQQTRLIYTGNDIVPFALYSISTEYGSQSSFTSINLDRGVITIGSRGIILTSQVSCERVDLAIPDQIFQFALKNNGAQRITAQRDFINEWVYFTYPDNEKPWKFPNQTLQYNYRDNSWAIFDEAFTSYGLFRIRQGLTWQTVGLRFPTWSEWNEPWNAGSSTLLQPLVIAGNQQGFIVFRDEGTAESISLRIESVSANTIQSTNHCLDSGDYIVIEGCTGSVAAELNGKIFKVGTATDNSFTISPNITAGSYFGGGVIKRMYVPKIQTKQFPISWQLARKTRIGMQQYLLTTTANGQITVQLFLSTAAAQAFNQGAIVPSLLSQNNSLVYSDILYTCPESVNLGLTPYQSNLQQITTISGSSVSSPQSQMWHRMNTSLIGDTVQMGFTLSDAQMRDTNFNSQFEEIELHGFVIDVTPSQILA